MSEVKPPDDSVCGLCRNLDVKDAMVYCTLCELPVHVECAGMDKDFTCIDCGKIKAKERRSRLKDESIRKDRFRKEEENNSKRKRTETPPVETVVQPSHFEGLTEQDYECECEIRDPAAMSGATQEKNDDALSLLLHIAERDCLIEELEHEEEIMLERQVDDHERDCEYNATVECETQEVDTLEVMKYDIMHSVLCRCQKASFINPFNVQFPVEDPEETLTDVLHWGLTEFAKISDGSFQWHDLPYKPEMIALLKNHVPSIETMATIDPLNLLVDRYFTGDDLGANVHELANITCLNARVIYHFPQETLSRTLFSLMKVNVEVRDLAEVEAFFGYR